MPTPNYNLKLSSGVYGSTFFMLTGFHGFHVFVGMLMLLFITLRLQKGHFTPSATLVLKVRPGIGTLWTWCGWVCISWCTGSDTPDATQKRHRLRCLFDGGSDVPGACELLSLGDAGGVDVAQFPGDQNAHE